MDSVEDCGRLAPHDMKPLRGVQSYGIVPAVDTENATDNTKLRQGLVQKRRLAESAYIDPTLALVEEYLSSYQAPIPGFTPYMYGTYI